MIDYELLAIAKRYYDVGGYTYVDVPWVVPQETAQLTFPGRGIVCNLGNLVGSAEQGFLQCPPGPGRFQAITPCFREEAHWDDYTRPYFMKLELFSSDLYPDYKPLLQSAAGFLAGWLSLDIDVRETDEGHDIYAGDVELGSYGARSAGGMSWVYGTGLALPRTSLVRG